MENNLSTSNTSAAESLQAGGFDFKKLLGDILAKWYWFVISVVVCVSVAAFYIVKQTPIYTRTATLLIKESNTRRSSATDIEALLSNAGQMTSKVANEVVVFQAPILMEEAVRKLGLTVTYGMHGGLRDVVAYGTQVPVNATFVDVPDELYITFDITPVDETSAEVSHIVYRSMNDKFKDKNTYLTTYGDTLVTDFGKVVLTRNPYYFSKTPWTKDEYVVKRSLASATRYFSANFTASAADARKFSDVLTLTINDASPRRADDLINMLINVYNASWVKDMNQMAVSTSLFITDRLAVVEDELTLVDKEISSYKSKNKLPDIAATSNMYITQTTDIVKRIRELENELSVTKYMRNYLGSNIDSFSLIPLPSGLTNTGLVSQVNEYNDLLLKRNNFVSVSSEQNPLVVDIDDALQSMRVAINASVENQVATLEEQISYAKTQESKTTEQLAQSPTQAKDLLDFERKQKVQESLYLYLLQKREENELSKAFTAYNTRIVNPPYGSTLPTSPKKRQILLLAFLLGLMIPVVVIYLQEILDTKIRSRKDLEHLKAPFLGEIPMSSSEQEHAPKGFKLSALKKNKVGESKENSLVVEPGNRDLINEAFRVLRTNLEFVSKVSGGGNAVMITSFNPTSGKTFISINLAVALAIKGKRVIVIDADFRRASFSRFFNLQGLGFANYLADSESNTVDSYIVKDVNGVIGMDVLPVGTIPPNPSELVSTAAFCESVNSLKVEYDYVFLDCAPVDIVADTQIISRCADRTIFVVRAGLLDKALLPDIDTIYNEGKYNNISIVLNGTELQNSYYHKRYSTRYHYGKSYGYAYGKGKERYGYYNYSDNSSKK